MKLTLYHRKGYIMKRYISLALLAAILLQTAACGGAESPTDTTASGSDTTVPATEETTKPYVPAELDYGGAEVSFFIRTENGSLPEFYAEEQNGESFVHVVTARSQSGSVSMAVR